MAGDDDVRRLAGLGRERQPLLEGVPFLIGRLLYRYAELLTAYGGFALPGGFCCTGKAQRPPLLVLDNRPMTFLVMDRG